jgi:hypothetical protein
VRYGEALCGRLRRVRFRFVWMDCDTVSFGVLSWDRMRFVASGCVEMRYGLVG